MNRIIWEHIRTARSYGPWRWNYLQLQNVYGGRGGGEWSSLRYWSSLQNDVTIIYNKAFILFIVSKKYSFKCQSNVMLSIYLKTYITCTCFRFWPCDHWAVKGFFYRVTTTVAEGLAVNIIPMNSKHVSCKKIMN